MLLFPWLVWLLLFFVLVSFGLHDVGPQIICFKPSLIGNNSFSWAPVGKPFSCIANLHSISWRNERGNREIELEGNSLKVTQDGTCMKNKVKQLQLQRWNYIHTLKTASKNVANVRRTIIPLKTASKNDENKRNINAGQADKSTDEECTVTDSKEQRGVKKRKVADVLDGLHSFRFTDSPEGVHLSGRAAARLAAALLLLNWNQEGDAQAPQREIIGKLVGRIKSRKPDFRYHSHLET